MDYWTKRELDNKRANEKAERDYAKEVKDIYSYMMDQINKEINGFYSRYARKTGITMAAAKKKVAETDIKNYQAKAKRYVKHRTFTAQANEEMRIYNLTMRVNRLEMLKSNIGLELVDGFQEMQDYFNEIFTDRALDEFERQAGILGKTVGDPKQSAKSIVGASFHNATWSERIWMYQAQLKDELDRLLQSAMIQGQSPTELARHLRRRFGVSQRDAERLMRTELTRVQTDAREAEFEANNFDMYQFNALGTACDECAALDEKHFKIEDMQPGKNAPPMHPNCMCAITAWMDDKPYQEWLDTYQDHHIDYDEWKKKYYD